MSAAAVTSSSSSSPSFNGQQIQTNILSSVTVNTRSIHKFLKCVLLNARSLKNKLPDLHYLIYSSCVDCVLITESWLNDNIDDGLLDPNDEYVIFRKDRQSTTGGGVCVLVRKELKVRKVDLNLLNSNLEMICLDVIFYASIYRFFSGLQASG